MPQSLIDTGSLHDTAVLGNIAKEHCQTTVLGIGMLDVTNTTVGTIGIQRSPLCTLATHLRREAVARSRLVDAIGFCIDSAIDNAVFLQGLAERHAIDTRSRSIDESSLRQFVHNT